MKDGCHDELRGAECTHKVFKAVMLKTPEGRLTRLLLAISLPKMDLSA
jgi:hypothetical protein